MPDQEKIKKRERGLINSGIKGAVLLGSSRFVYLKAGP